MVIGAAFELGMLELPRVPGLIEILTLFLVFLPCQSGSTGCMRASLKNVIQLLDLPFSVEGIIFRNTPCQGL